MVSWENTDLFLKHDGLPRTNKLVFETWLINKYIMILHFKSAFCLKHQLLKEIFQFLGKQQEHKKSSAELGLFYKVKFLNTEMSGRKAAVEHSEERQQGQSDCSILWVWLWLEGAQRSFCRTFIEKHPSSHRIKLQKEMFSHFCTHLSCALLSGNINPAGIWKNTRGHESAPPLIISPCTGQGMCEQKDISLQDSQSQT